MTYIFEYTRTTKLDGRSAAGPGNQHTTRHLCDSDDVGNKFDSFDELQAYLLGSKWDNLKVFKIEQVDIVEPEETHLPIIKEIA